MKWLSKAGTVIDWVFSSPFKFYAWLQTRTNFLVRAFFLALLFVFMFTVCIPLLKYRWPGIVVFSITFFFTTMFIVEVTNEVIRKMQDWASPLFIKSFKLGGIYIHTSIVYVLLLGIMISALPFLMEGLALWLIALPLGLLVIVAAAYGIYRYKDEPVAKMGQQLQPVITILDNTIVFNKNYYFRRATVNKHPVVKAEQVNEMMLDTYPPSAVINNNEVVFFTSALKDDLSSFAHRNKLTISARREIWMHILNPYLDTEYTAEDEERDFDTLEKEGLTRNEVKSIRKRVALNMWGATYATWEWVYYGHFDVLLYHASFPWKNFYWESMNIALRNFRK